MRIRGRLRSLATACYPPVVLDLRIEEQGRIRGPGHVGVALVDVAVVLALAPLPVRGQEVESVDSGHRPLGSLLVPARAGCGCGLLTATARGVGALGLDVTGGGLLTAAGRAISIHVSLPAGEIGVTASGRTLSRIARVTARGQVGDYLALLPACGRRRQDGWPDEKPRKGVGAVASQPPVVSEAAAAVTPVAGGAVLTALPSVLQDLARCFLSLSGSSSLWQLEALRE